MAELRDPLAQELALKLGATTRPVTKLLVEIDRKLSQHPELWGANEAAAFLGIRHNNMYKLRDFPQPVYDKPRGRLWLADDIKAFQNRRLDRVE